MVTTPIKHPAPIYSPSHIECKIAETLEERAAAFELVYEAYICSRLGESNPWGMRITPYHLLPSTQIFIAVHQGEVVLTFSLLCDGELGLPIEMVYGEEIDCLRNQGLRFGEVSCLADRRQQINGDFFPCFINLSRMVVQYSHRQGLDGLLVAAHPKHGRFYRRLMGFDIIGEEKSYPAVRNRPAVALCLDYARLPEHRPDCHQMFFRDPFYDWQLEPKPISRSQQDYFEPMIDPSYSSMLFGEAEELTGTC
jgi:hypothetical protein